MNQEILVISGQEYTLKTYIERRRTSLCSIGKNINIRIPTFLSSKDQLSEIERLKTWAIKKIQDNPPISKTIKEYNSGDILTIGEKKYTLVITTGDIERSRGRLRDDNIILTIPSSLKERNRQEEISKLINKIISRERLSVLEKIRSKGYKIYLFHYNDYKRKSRFSMSNHLETACDRTFLIKKDDLEKSRL